jgi:4-amino-4-deoxy-L-arabinose transferase-like glycosyltransferase
LKRVTRKIDRGSWVLLAIAAAFVFRFWKLKSAPFIFDEPIFELILDDHFKNGSFPQHALVGSRGVPYGPFVLWWHGLWRFLSDSLAVVFVANILAFAATFTALYVIVKRSCGKTPALFALALAVSSPFFFFYSRLVWDVVLLPAMTSLLLLAISWLEERDSKSAWVLLGVGAGMAFDIHLMVLPVLAAAGVVALYLAWKRRAWQGIALAVLVFLLVTSPYLLILKDSKYTAATFETYGKFPYSTLREALGVFQFLTPHGMKYFFDGALSSYMTTVIEPQLLVLPGFNYIVAGLLCLAVVVFGLRLAKRKETSPVLLLSVLSFFFLLVYYALVPVPWIHPHYFLPVWWLGAVFTAFTLARARERFQLPLKILVGFVIATNFIFTVTTFSAVYERKGTLGVHYGPGFAEIEDAVVEICEAMKVRSLTTAAIDISRAYGSFDPSYRYFAQHRDECKGLTLVFAGENPQFKVVHPEIPQDARLIVQ